MDTRQRNIIIRICATVADLFFGGEMETCKRTDCPMRQPCSLPANADALREQIRELLAELAKPDAREARAPYGDATGKMDELNELLREFEQTMPNCQS